MRARAAALVQHPLLDELLAKFGTFLLRGASSFALRAFGPLLLPLGFLPLLLLDLVDPVLVLGDVLGSRNPRADLRQLTLVLHSPVRVEVFPVVFTGKQVVMEPRLCCLF